MISRKNVLDRVSPASKRLLATLLSSLSVLAVLSCLPTAALAKPENLRQVGPGYWLSGEVDADDLRHLESRGIKTIVGLAAIDKEVIAAIRDAGFDYRRASYGRSFVDTAKLEPILELDPESVLLHCTHGGDRTGLVLAWLLVVRHDWPADHALLAVLYPSVRDLTRLTALLEERGHTLTDDEVEEHLGRFSGARNGGTGGLKIPHSSFALLIGEMLDTLPPRAAALEEGEKAQEERPLPAEPDPSDETSSAHHTLSPGAEFRSSGVGVESEQAHVQ